MIEVAVACELPDIDCEPLAERVRGVCRHEGVEAATVGLMVVDERRMHELNATHRGVDRPTDVLSFPIDGRDSHPGGPPPELGDIVICPAAATEPLTTLAIHGVLHLLGYDHETDSGQMLERQDRLVALLA